MVSGLCFRQEKCRSAETEICYYDSHPVCKFDLMKAAFIRPGGMLVDVRLKWQFDK